MEEKLKNCPFCGSPARNFNRRAVGCPNCGASIRSWEVSGGEEEIIKAWNTRAPQDVCGDLHAEIMNIQAPKKEEIEKLCNDMFSYKIGHRDARHAAAELSLCTHKQQKENVDLLREAIQIIKIKNTSHRAIYGVDCPTCGPFLSKLQTEKDGELS